MAGQSEMHGQSNPAGRRQPGSRRQEAGAKQDAGPAFQELTSALNEPESVNENVWKLLFGVRPSI